MFKNKVDTSQEGGLHRLKNVGLLISQWLPSFWAFALVANSGERWSNGWSTHLSTGGSIPPPPFQSLGNFFHPTLPVSFRRDGKSRWSLLSGVYARGSKSRWSLLSGVYARGSKRSHAGKWKNPVMDSITLEKDTLK